MAEIKDLAMTKMFCDQLQEMVDDGAIEVTMPGGILDCMFRSCAIDEAEKKGATHLTVKTKLDLSSFLFELSLGLFSRASDGYWNEDAGRYESYDETLENVMCDFTSLFQHMRSGEPVDGKNQFLFPAVGYNTQYIKQHELKEKCDK